jgi:hypothetical protein
MNSAYSDRKSSTPALPQKKRDKFRMTCFVAKAFFENEHFPATNAAAWWVLA